MGLKVEEMPGIIMMEAAAGTAFIMYEKDAAVPTNTVLGFNVEDLDATLKELKARGVQQDMKDLPEGSDENGIMTYGPVRSCWINDSEGNIIALNEGKMRSRIDSLGLTAILIV